MFKTCQSAACLTTPNGLNERKRVKRFVDQGSGSELRQLAGLLGLITLEIPANWRFALREPFADRFVLPVDLGRSQPECFRLTVSSIYGFIYPKHFVSDENPNAFCISLYLVIPP